MRVIEAGWLFADVPSSPHDAIANNGMLAMILCRFDLANGMSQPELASCCAGISEQIPRSDGSTSLCTTGLRAQTVTHTVHHFWRPVFLQLSFARCLLDSVDKGGKRPATVSTLGLVQKATSKVPVFVPGASMRRLPT